MTRKKLLNLICPSNRMHDCENYHCVDCNLLLIKWLDEYDKHVIEQYKANTNLKDTIREIHDNVAREMYCKGIDDCKELTFREVVYCDSLNDRTEFRELAEQLKERNNE